MAESAARTCFVTVGATASFEGLVKAVLSKPVQSELHRYGYTHLIIQYGKDGQHVYEKCLDSNTAQQAPLAIEGFDFSANGLTDYMVEARDTGGCVISHAGSGSILEALRISVPLLVVPNAALLDNHQEELAAELSRQGYVVHGRLDNLASAVCEVDSLAKKRKAWPPVNSGVHRQAPGLQGIIDEELGYLD